jgi:hypothetical protein
MILATEEFQSDSWPVRNSALMCFTSLIKRFLGAQRIQDQDLSRKKGISVKDFIEKHERLFDYFLTKLGHTMETSVTKEEKERKDLTVFSIMLLLSRLIPSPVEESERLQKMIEAIKKYNGNGTYFVRKISAQALLPFLPFSDYMVEIQSTVSFLIYNSTKPKKLK